MNNKVELESSIHGLSSRFLGELVMLIHVLKIGNTYVDSDIRDLAKRYIQDVKDLISKFEYPPTATQEPVNQRSIQISRKDLETIVMIVNRCQMPAIGLAVDDRTMLSLEAMVGPIGAENFKLVEE